MYNWQNSAEELQKWRKEQAKVVKYVAKIFQKQWCHRWHDSLPLPHPIPKVRCNRMMQHFRRAGTTFSYGVRGAYQCTKFFKHFCWLQKRVLTFFGSKHFYSVFQFVCHTARIQQGYNEHTASIQWANKLKYWITIDIRCTKKKQEEHRCKIRWYVKGPFFSLLTPWIEKMKNL